MVARERPSLEEEGVELAYSYYLLGHLGLNDDLQEKGKWRGMAWREGGREGEGERGTYK